MPLRKLFIILLLINFLLLAGGRMGWLGESGVRGEPERLTNQLHPEYIHPGLPPPLPVESSPPSASCIAYTLDVSQSEDVGRIAAEIDGEIAFTHEQSGNNGSWRVRIPPLASNEETRAREDELRALGVEDLFVIRTENPERSTISLGLFSAEKHARQRLESLHELGVTDAELLPPLPRAIQAEFRGRQSSIDALAQRLGAAFPGALRRNCTP